MAFSFVLLSETRKELNEIIAYYFELTPELAEDFTIKFYDSLNLIVESPLAFRKIKSHYRKVNLIRFPYKVIFRVNENVITVVAICHQKRRPFYWRGR